MEEHEQLTDEMNLALELLENLIRSLPISIPRQDELSMYARQLKEAAYRAGRSEKRS